MARSYAFITVDVFTARAFAGNPLAVFPDARGLSSRQMQQLAREFNYSESTFVLPPKKRVHTAQVRIFTPKGEIPFAGHPNVGTAFVLSSFGKNRKLSTLLFEEGAGVVPVELMKNKRGRVTGAMLTAPQPLQLGEEIPAETVAACLGLPKADVVTTRHRPRVASVGLPFVIAEITESALARCRPDVREYENAARRHPSPSLRFSIFVYARLAGARLQARMFAPLGGVYEDPATGSANCALVGLLAQLAPEKDLDLKLQVWQGVEMGRPSRLVDIAEKRAGVVTRIRVGGDCAPVLEGRVSL